jgi:hypothetical protein
MEAAAPGATEKRDKARLFRQFLSQDANLPAA